ncbi:hypothetical protein [Streptomyces sp. NPDC005322]|uniref:hypothetical protein n=1 Tax=Streptomyces sp. NPDC005322 TaxID=3157032 RepID=UPI0033A938D8
MSKKQQAFVWMGAAIVGQVLLGKVAKQQAAALGIPAIVVGLAGIAIGTALG